MQIVFDYLNTPTTCLTRHNLIISNVENIFLTSLRKKKDSNTEVLVKIIVRVKFKKK